MKSTEPHAEDIERAIAEGAFRRHVSAVLDAGIESLVFNIIVLVPLMAFAMRGAVAAETLTTWIAVAIAINAARLVTSLSWKAGPSLRKRLPIRVWGGLVLVERFLTGCAWGSVVFLIDPSGGWQTEFALFILTAGIAVAAPITTSSWLPAARVIVYPTLIPWVAWYGSGLASGDRWLALIALAIIFVAERIGHRGNQVFQLASKLEVAVEKEASSKEALAGLAALYEDAANHSNDALAIFDDQERLISFNRNWPAMMGMTDSQPIEIGVQFTDLVDMAFLPVPETARPMVKARTVSWFRDPEVRSSEYPMKDRWIRISKFAGTDGATILIHADITADKERQAALERERQQFQVYLDQSPVAVAVFDKDGAYRFVSSEWCALFEADPAYFEGRNLIALASRAGFADFGIDNMLLQETRSGEIPGFPTVKGSLIDLRWKSHGWIDSVSGEAHGFILFAEDVSIERHRETLLKDRVHELEVTRESLAAARDAAEAASAARSDFVATVSHELRTPLNGVIGLTDLLMDTGLSSEQRELATTIRSSGRSLLAIINDILDFSKLEAGQMRIAAQPLSIFAVIEEVLESLTPQARAKGLDFVDHFPPDLPLSVSGDEARLKQLLYNVIGNAVKFTERGHIRVRPSIIERSENAITIRFMIQDTGIGIRASESGRLFNAFSQVDSSRSRQFGGTGLGLAICKRLVEAMGGDIGFEPAQPNGTRFWFTLTFKDPKGEVPFLADYHDVAGRRMLALWPYGLEGATAYARPGVARDCSSADEALRLLGEAASANAPYGLFTIEDSMAGADPAQFLQAVCDVTGDKRPAIVVIVCRGRDHVWAPLKDQFGLTILGKPTRFLQRLRTAQAVLGMRGHEPGPDIAVAGRTLGGRPLRILLAEDNPANVLLASRTLGREGWTVDSAANGALALEAAQSIQYDIILMDVQMPVMDGVSATRFLRELDITIPIIALTANAMPGDRETYLAAGMDDYLAKPFTPSQLTTKVAFWCGLELEAAVETPAKAEATASSQALDALTESL